MLISRASLLFRRKSVTLEEVKTIPVLDVAHWLGLKLRGRSAHCFAHTPDRHPSLVFNLRRNTFKCYVCPEIHGSVIDLVMQVRECSCKEAIKMLETYAGKPIRYRPSGPSLKRRRDASLSPEYKGMILDTLLQAAPLEKEGLRYLIGRGIDPDTALRMGVGSLRPETYQSLFRVLVSLHGRSALRRSGLTHFFLLAKEGLSFLLFPYRSRKRTHLIKARCLLTKEEADGRNIRRFVATEPAEILYNQDAVQSASPLYLCEGEIDTLTMIQRGYAAIGIPGVNSFREDWFKSLAGKQVILCLDNDEAWEKASEWFNVEFSRHGITHSRFVLPAGMDINQYFQQKEVCLG